MSAQRASAPARLAGIVAAVTLLALAAAVALRLVPRRDEVRRGPSAPPPEGRVVDVKERVRHEEFRAGRLVAEVRGETFFLGPDGRNHLKGSVEVVHYGPGGEVGSRLTAGEVVYTKGELVFTVTGEVRVEAGGVVLEGDAFDYDGSAGLFRTASGGRFVSKTLAGQAREIAYREDPEEIRLGGGFRAELAARDGAGRDLVLSGDSFVFERRERRGRAEGTVGLESADLTGSSAAASLAVSEDGSSLASAVLEGGAVAVLGGKRPSSGAVGEVRADRIAVTFSAATPGVAIAASGGSRLAFGPAAGRMETVLAPTALLNFSRDEGRASWSASGGVRTEIAEAGVVSLALEGAEAVLDSARVLHVTGGPGRPAVADSSEARIEAPSISVESGTGALFASGGVAGVLKGEEGRRKIGFFSPREDVIFSCRRLEMRPGIPAILFSGDVLARQGANTVRAEELETSGESGRLSGRRGVAISLAEAADGRASGRPVELGGREMGYEPGTGTLTLSSTAFVGLPEARLEAGTVSAAIGRDDGRLGSLSARTGVVVSKGRFAARAEAAFYEAAVRPAGPHRQSRPDRSGGRFGQGGEIDFRSGR